MVALLADEKFNHRILRGLRLRSPALDCLPVQETEIYQQEDPKVLDWAAAHNPSCTDARCQHDDQVRV